MPRLTRQHRDIHPQLRNRAVPFGVEVGVEQQGVVGVHREPGIALDFLIELACAPPGIA